MTSLMVEDFEVSAAFRSALQTCEREGHFFRVCHGCLHPFFGVVLQSWNNYSKHEACETLEVSFTETEQPMCPCGHNLMHFNSPPATCTVVCYFCCCSYCFCLVAPLPCRPRQATVRRIGQRNQRRLEKLREL